MRFNHMTSENEIKKDYSPYIIMAVVGAFIFALFLDIAVKILIMFGKVLFKYWWASVIILLIIIFLRRKRKKKQ